MEHGYHPTKPHRPEIEAYIKSLWGKTVSEEEFIAGYKALGLPRTQPAKGRGIYKYLVSLGHVQTA